VKELIEAIRGNPYHEPAGISIGGHFAHAPGLLDAEQKEWGKSLGTHEVGLILTPSGVQLTRVEGESHSVAFIGPARGFLRGNVVSHNHWAIPCSFSDEDLRFAAKNGLDEMRIVTENSIFSIKPPLGEFGQGQWPGVLSVNDWLMGQGQSIYEKVAKEWDKGGMSADEMDYKFSHLRSLAFAKKFGCTYTETPRRTTESEIINLLEGGKGSGNFGHRGRPNLVGGSAQGVKTALGTNGMLAAEIAEWGDGVPKNETGFILDTDGKVLFRQGGNEISVTWNKEQVRAARGKILTHNHPKGYDTSFSEGDWRCMSIMSLAEIRAVTGKYVFSLKPRILHGAPYYDSTMYEVLDKADNKMYRKLKGIRRSGISDLSEVEFYHDRNVEAAEELGYIYTRTER
jgi:hypothetical protein